ncbi:MAG: hypothetical protein CMQ40_11750 [Gammaproteobacteria bacterium]|nr:hypothetical protein [Gammaproteobacteria bacterium]
MQETDKYRFIFHVARVSGAYMALLIGGAFATGQEAMQFFVGYGPYGFGGLLVCCVLMIYTCWSLMRAGKEQNLRTNEEAFRYFCGKHLGIAMTWYTMVMIVAVYAVMLSGVAATLEQAYGLPIHLGASLMAVFATGTLLLGLQRIIEVLGVIGPVIVILTLVTATASLFDGGFDLEKGFLVGTDLEMLRASDNWLFSGVLYVGLAMPGLAAFLPLVGSTMASEAEINGISLAGPICFIGAMAIVVLALIGNLESVLGAEVPVLVLATEVFPIYGSIFAVVIFLGIYTTVTPLLWTVCRRFFPEDTSRFRILALGLTLVCLLGGNLLPFGQLINWIYPSIGYVGLLFMCCLIYKDIQDLRPQAQ